MSKRKNKTMTKMRKNAAKSDGLVNFLRVLGLVLPLSIYLAFTTIVCPSPNSGFLALGCFGAMIVGLGLINVVGMIQKLHLGHLVTFLLISTGAIFIGISLIVMYVPEIYALWDEHTVTLYFFVWISLVAMAIFYFFSRRNVHNVLRERKISKSRIKELLKGKKNFWWFEAVHETYEMGSFYLVNKLFTSAFAIILLVHATIGLFRPIALVVSFGTALLCFLSSALFWLASAPLTSDKKKDLNMLIVVGVSFFFVLNGVALVYYSVS